KALLRVYVDHYNRERPHRALELRPPDLTRHKQDRMWARSTAATTSVASSTSTTEPPPETDTNNGALHAHNYAHMLHSLGLRHLRIKLGRPRTNGKAERLFQTLLNRWASTRIYGSSAERSSA